MLTHTLSIDIETFSSVDLKKCGVYKYAASPDFEILICCYKWNDGPVHILPLDDPDFDDIRIYEEFRADLQNPAILKTAFNAPFERTCMAAYFKVDLPADQWECTMAKAYTCGMSGTLGDVAGVLKVGEKMYEGKELINYFCKPCKPTKANGGRTRNYPHHDPEKFKRFQQYCIRDVELEYTIRKKLSGFKQPDMERELWILDQKINDLGVKVDLDFIHKAIAIDDKITEDITRKAVALTGIRNMKSVQQLKRWIEAEEELEEEIDSLAATAIPALLQKFNSEAVKELLSLRAFLSKSSTKKYLAMVRCALDGGIICGLLQYYGASRTGRWAGRLFQPHNLAKSDLENIDKLKDLPTGKNIEMIAMARELVKQMAVEVMDIIYDSIPAVLSCLIRTALVPREGCRFLVDDFSSIEARITAWAAGEQWRLEVFRGDGRIYEVSAAKMFNVPIAEVTKGSTHRNKGKMGELALGYQGGPGAIRRIEIGNKTPLHKMIPEKELQPITDAWRTASPRIMGLWYAMQATCFDAIRNPGEECRVEYVRFYDKYQGREVEYFFTACRLSFQVKGGVLYMKLPSGRKLVYLKPAIVEGKYGDTISYEAKDDKNKWGRVETYGGKLWENACQAIARDLLAGAMLRLDKAGYVIPFHVHDEVVAEMPWGKGSIEEMSQIMSVVPDWAEGLPLNAEGFETEYYKKD